MDEQIAPPPSPPILVHPIVQTMANFMNYLSVSLYEDQFTKNHQDSYATLHSIYDSVALTPSMPPYLVDCEQFFRILYTWQMSHIQMILIIIHTNVLCGNILLT